MSIYRWVDKEDAHIYTMEHYPAIKKMKKKTICSNMPELEIIILSEASQSEKDK